MCAVVGSIELTFRPTASCFAVLMANWQLTWCYETYDHVLYISKFTKCLSGFFCFLACRKLKSRQAKKLPTCLQNLFKTTNCTYVPNLIEIRDNDDLCRDLRSKI